MVSVEAHKGLPQYTDLVLGIEFKALFAQMREVVVVTDAGPAFITWRKLSMIPLRWSRHVVVLGARLIEDVGRAIVLAAFHLARLCGFPVALRAWRQGRMQVEVVLGRMRSAREESGWWTCWKLGPRATGECAGFSCDRQDDDASTCRLLFQNLRTSSSLCNQTRRSAHCPQLLSQSHGELAQPSRATGAEVWHDI